MITNFFRSVHRQLPMILQNENAECGLACMAMIGVWHGHEIDLASLRRRFPETGRGANLKQLVDIASQLQFNSRPLKLEIEQIKDLQTPCILHWDLNHFVVLRSVGPKTAIIHDPALGSKQMTQEQIAKHFTGIALELKPVQNFAPVHDKQRLQISQVFGRVAGLKRSLIQVLVLSSALLTLGMSIPVFIQLVFDEAMGNFDSQLLLLLVLGLASVTIFRSMIAVFRGYLILFIGNFLSSNTAASVFRLLIHLPLKYFESRHLGDVVSRFSSLEQIQKFLTEGMVEVLVDGIMTALMLILMIVYSGQLSFIAITTISVYALFRVLTFISFRSLSEEAIVARAKEQSTFMETVRGIQCIRLYAGENDRHSLWQNLYTSSLNMNNRLGRFRVHFQGVRELLFGLEKALVIFVGANLVFKQQISPGMFIAFLSYKDQFAEKVSSLIENGLQFKMLELHIDRVADIVLQEAETCDEDEIVEEEFLGDFELRGLSFRYDIQSPYTFKDLNLKVATGESIAIIGSSGCGKTTLLKAMVGLFQTEEGSILVDGKNIKGKKRNFQKHIATVMQNDQLLSGSLSDNIAFFDPQPNMDRVVECAEMACIHADIAEMPMRYNSLVGDMGSTLSGGQKQRLLLARALYRKPRILFLDEATSHLDSRMENLVNLGIRNLKITRIVIAHRLETILSADRIFMMAGGQLTEIDRASAVLQP